MRAIVFFIVGAVLIVGCGKQTLDPVSYIKYVESEENGLNVSKKIGNVTYNIQYKPKPYLVLRKEGPQRVQSEPWNDLMNGYDDVHYVDLRLKSSSGWDFLKSDVKQTEDYFLRIKYLSSDIQRDVSLIQGQDTLNCVFSHFERTYGMTPYANVVLAFEKPTKVEDHPLTFVYHDRLTNGGIVKIQLTESALSNIPNLKI